MNEEQSTAPRMLHLSIIAEFRAAVSNFDPALPEALERAIDRATCLGMLRESGCIETCTAVQAIERRWGPLPTPRQDCAGATERPRQ